MIDLYRLPRKKDLISDFVLTKMKTVLSFGVFRPRADCCIGTPAQNMEKDSISQRSSGVEQLSCKQPVIGSNPVAGSLGSSGVLKV